MLVRLALRYTRSFPRDSFPEKKAPGIGGKKGLAAKPNTRRLTNTREPGERRTRTKIHCLRLFFFFGAFLMENVGTRCRCRSRVSPLVPRPSGRAKRRRARPRGSALFTAPSSVWRAARRTREQRPWRRDRESRPIVPSVSDNAAGSRGVAGENKQAERT